jgi:hypothetical protein
MNPLLNKVKALLSKTVENGATKEEAANAARIAQSIITKHRLEFVELSADNEIGEHSPLYFGKRIVYWRSDLAYWVCQFNGCQIIYRKLWSDENKDYVIGLSIIGRSSDVAVVRYLFEHISREIERLCTQALAENKGSGKHYANSFKHGAVSMIVRRMRLAHEAVLNAQPSNSTAIVKLDQRAAEVEAWMKSSIKLKSHTDLATRSFSAEGYQAGRDAGASISLNKALDK